MKSKCVTRPTEAVENIYQTIKIYARDSPERLYKAYINIETDINAYSKWKTE